MSLASWFSVVRSHLASARNHRVCRSACRQPIHPRPCLEPLEERMLLDASSGLIGGVNNLAFNGAAASSGNILPIPTSGEHAASISGIDASGRSAQASSDALLAQDQPNAQLRLFSINSLGEGSRYVQQTTANILRDAYGFGSGTMPNAPWMPNAYNLGLADHQFNYSSETDLGFSSVPPWYHGG
jgi:hypothetical protein